MLTLLTFLLILSVLVLIHEFGHFIAARKNGVWVEEFGWGIPPRLFGKKFGETLYSVNLLPLGGFVKVYGEDTSEDGSKESPKSFYTKSPKQRLVILFAGVIMNLLLAYFLYVSFFVVNSSKTFYMPLLFDHKFLFGEQARVGTVISGFLDESPLKNAGIQPGEAIIDIDGTAVFSAKDVRRVLKDKAGQEVVLTLDNISDRSTQLREVKTMPILDYNKDVVLGVYMSDAVSIRYHDPITGSFLHLINMTNYTFSTMGKFINLSFEERSLEPVSSGVSGPVGIYSIVHAIVTTSSEARIMTLVDFTAMLSLSLAIMNLLPIPALDGGRIIFVFYELITKRRVSEEFEAKIHRWGMVGLLALFALVSLKDLRMFFF